MGRSIGYNNNYPPNEARARGGGGGGGVRVSLLPHRISRNSSDFGFCAVTKVRSLSLSLMRTVSLSDQNCVFSVLQLWVRTTLFVSSLNTG